MPNRSIHDIIDHRECVTVLTTATVRQVTCLMKEHQAHAVVVVDRKKELVGICTERDVVFGVVATGRDPEHTKVATVMTTRPQCIGAEKPFGHALHLMYEGGFRHVPVVDDDGRPLGVLSPDDASQLEAIDFGRELVQREEITVIL